MYDFCGGNFPIIEIQTLENDDHKHDGGGLGESDSVLTYLTTPRNLELKKITINSFRQYISPGKKNHDLKKCI